MTALDTPTGYDTTVTPRPRENAELLETAMSVLRAHQERAARTVTLIPAENTPAPITLLPYVTDIGARYMFDDDPDPDTSAWHFPSARDAAWLETGLAVPAARRLLAAEHVNVRPLSGLHAMHMVIAALAGGRADTVVCVAADQGGHYATGDIATRLGHRVAHLTGTGIGTVDLDALAATCRATRPTLVYLDQCHTLRPLDTAAIVATVHDACPGTRVHADISHTLGLVMGGALRNPLDDGADSLSASTHKSFPGPQKGLIATRDARVRDLIATIQPQMVSNHHFAAVASLGLALVSFADRCGEYARTVVTNARTLGRELAHAGWDVVGADFGHTLTHQLWIRDPHRGAREAARRLYAAGIDVNWLTDLPLDTPALRLGLAEATWTGLVPADMPPLAAIMTAAVHDREPAAVLAERTAALRARAGHPFAPTLGPAASVHAHALLEHIGPTR
ncbi:hypothetical protein ACFZBU_39235 [Embleya sp. NPDC008237]|uniref:hypothetical protein n=1 Tax=Embleya sp. NPDC008237 TaxID=3363978 RepID=UPI0036E30B4E